MVPYVDAVVAVTVMCFGCGGVGGVGGEWVVDQGLERWGGVLYV